MDDTEKATIHEVMRVALLVDVGRDFEKIHGVHDQVDYEPIGRFAELVDHATGARNLRFPIKTSVYTFPDAAYVAEQDQPVTVIYGESEATTERIVSRLSVPRAEIIALSALVQATKD